jgi:hypothetical protein
VGLEGVACDEQTNTQEPRDERRYSSPHFSPEAEAGRKCFRLSAYAEDCGLCPSGSIFNSKDREWFGRQVPRPVIAG